MDIWGGDLRSWVGLIDEGAGWQVWVNHQIDRIGGEEIDINQAVAVTVPGYPEGVGGGLSGCNDNPVADTGLACDEGNYGVARRIGDGETLNRRIIPGGRGEVVIDTGWAGIDLLILSDIGAEIWRWRVLLLGVLEILHAGVDQVIELRIGGDRIKTRIRLLSVLDSSVFRGCIGVRGVLC